MSTIQPRLVTLDELLYGRLFRIPEYQRNYSWHRKQRQDLFQDLERTSTLNESRSHFMATIVGLRREKITIRTKEHFVIEVVDGQQRLTTLILLLRAIAIKLQSGGPDSQEAGRALEEILVKPDQASLLLLQTNHDTSHYFANYLRTGNHPPSNSAQTLADRELLSAMEDCESFVEKWVSESGRTLEELVVLVKNRVSFVFHEITDEALVYTVFEVLNSRGLDVTWFDRLKSMLMAVVFESDTGDKDSILDEVHRVWADIYRCIGLRLGLSSESLRFAATLRTTELQNRLLNEENSAETLHGLSAGNAARVIETSLWLKQVTEALDNLVSDPRLRSVTRILHARFVAVSVILREDLTDDEKSTILRRWENVTFRIYGMFAKDARTAVGDYVRLGWRIMNRNLSTNQILKLLSSIGSDYPIKDAVEHLRRKDCYTEWHSELRYFFYRYEEHLAEEAGQRFDNEQWGRIWTASASKSIEHILPQSSGESFVHYLGNLIVLPPGLNSQLQDDPPEEKATAYNRTGLLIAQEVIDELPDWGRESIEKREDALLRWASEEWSD